MYEKQKWQTWTKRQKCRLLTWHTHIEKKAMLDMFVSAQPSPKLWQWCNDTAISFTYESAATA